MARGRITLVAVLLLCAATSRVGFAAEWKRYFANGPMAETWDFAVGHPLQYFLTHPCLRTDPDDRVITCPKNPLPEKIQNYVRARIERRLIGQFGAMSVFDVDYFLAESATVSTPGLRTVLVEEKPDVFREIYVARKLVANATFSPGEFLQVNGRKFLKQRFESGPNGEFYEDYFVASKDTVEHFDMGLIYEAADLAAPPGKIPWHAWSRFTFPDTWRVAIAAETAEGCCAGVITVRFRLGDTRASVTGTKFDPSADPSTLRQVR
ncbi:MAG: hypothetical protein ABL967_04250 [Bryobacteraceae bacterium]